jgi:hypothetical protein
MEEERNSRRPSLTLHTERILHATASSVNGIYSVPPRIIRNRLRKSDSVRRAHSISQTEAEWFFSLPEKVRRTHFSREEQVLIAGRVEPHEFDAPSEFLQHGYESGQDVTGGPELYEKDLFEFAPTRFSTERPRSQSLSHDSVIQQDRMKDSDSEILHLDKMPPPTPDESTTRRSRRSSIRRTLSLTTNNFIRQSTSSAPAIMSPFYTSSTSSWRPRAGSNATPLSPDAISSPLDPSAKHYQDPEARMKLRLYLASPQKFDEAIEFGFPSTAQPDIQAVSLRRVSDAGRANLDVQTFLRDDNVSIMESQFDDAASGADGTDDERDNSPTTPASSTDPFQFITQLTSSKFSSFDSTNNPSLALRDFTQESQHQTSLPQREMTLRMTLTRPDLRAKEEELYGWQRPIVGKDPLALEDLPPAVDDVTGAHGAFAVNKCSKGIMGKLFMRVKKGRA